MRTRSSSTLVGNSSSNPTTSDPKRRNRRRSKQPFSLEESPVDTMADQRTMAELLRAPTEGYAEAIVVPLILAEHFEAYEKADAFSFLSCGAARRWLEKEPPYSILTWEDLVSKFINELFPPSRTTNLRNEISNFEQRFGESFHEAWDRYKDLLRACPHHGFTELHQLDTFYNALNPTDQDSLNSAAGGNLLERSTRDVLTIIENKSKVRNSRNKSIVSQVKSSDVNSSSSSEIAKLTHAVNQQTSAVTTTMTAILKQFQATPPPASVKACLTADGNTFLEFRDNIQGYVSAAAVNYNQGNSGYRPPSVANQIRPPGFAQPNVQNNQNRFSQPQGYNRGNNFNQNANYQAPIQQNQSVPLSELEKIKKKNKANMKAMQNQITNVKNELRNEMQNSIQTLISNQTNELKNMMASIFQMNTASTSGTGSLPINTVVNPKGELKAITTRSGLVLDGPSIPIPPPFINPEEGERVEETLTDPKHDSDHLTPQRNITVRKAMSIPKYRSGRLKRPTFALPGGDELALMCGRMFPEESDEVEKYIDGLPDMIQGNVMLARPKTMQETIELANDLMDQKVRAYAERQAENKRKFDNNNQAQQQLPKRQNVVQAYTIGSGEKKEYVGTLPLRNKCKFHHHGPCTEPPLRQQPTRNASTTTDAPMSATAINQLIERRVVEALANQEQLRNNDVNGDGSQNSRSGTERPSHTPRECTFKDFLNYQPLTFKGTEGVVGLTQWFKKMESVFHISNCTVENQVKFATCTLLGATLIWWTPMSERMFPEESDEHEKLCFVADAERQAENKRKFDNNNQAQQQHPKRQNWHYKSDCLKLRNQNHGNQAEDTEAHGVVYALGGEKTDQDPNNIEDEIEAQEEDFLASTSER
ncbi:reverse transcriptase domain-containing protein [Tanacetum coccineum]|uniref:Reverse transcriptase domain-containing protein n=1 Tax=Tanacetum coccineum TaxID=301880 RepID=A0ABQ5J702_9ASTR